MKDTWVEPESGVWVIEGRSPRIEYSLKVMDEICSTAMGGLQKLSRGGIEVGGVLYGDHSENVVRIRAWRQIPCEHSKGPAFVLSPSDTQGLESLLKLEDPTLDGLQPVGWFVSHTKSEINLRSGDQEIFDRYFRHPWQVTLVLRPARHRGTDAGFFFRETDGAMRTASSYKTFSVAAFARFSAHHEPAIPKGTPRATPLSERLQSSEAQQRDASDCEPPKQTGQKSSRLLLALWILLALGAAGGLIYHFYFTDRNPYLAFRATDMDGQMRLEWDHKSPWIRKAERGELEINDGGKKFAHQLTAEILRTGSFVYVRKSDDVDLRLTVQQQDQKAVSESSRFLGQPTSRAFAAEFSRLATERDQLRAEKQAEIAKRLAETKKLDDEKVRTRQLQQQVRVLQQQVDSLRNEVRGQ